MPEEKKEKSGPNILFFCRECQHVVKEPKKVGNKYVYKCPDCKTDNVAFGTKKSICSYFRLKEKDLK